MPSIENRLGADASVPITAQTVWPADAAFAAWAVMVGGVLVVLLAWSVARALRQNGLLWAAAAAGLHALYGWSWVAGPWSLQTGEEGGGLRLVLGGACLAALLVTLWVLMRLAHSSGGGTAAVGWTALSALVDAALVAHDSGLVTLGGPQTLAVWGRGLAVVALGVAVLAWGLAQIDALLRSNGVLREELNRYAAEWRGMTERLRRAQRQHDVDRERRRIMREMHDGLGSQLVQALNLVRQSPDVVARASIEPLLVQALDELRLTLDSLEPMEGDLPAVLGTIRQRLGPTLEAAGIELRWAVQDVAPLPMLDSRGVLHLFRCLQEIFANIVKHAHARTVTVATWQHRDFVLLTVEDDGQGMPPGTLSGAQGRGVRNVLARATKIGATVRFYDAHPGTGVRFCFSLRLGRPDAS
ncbi:hypothetical protein LCC91_05480 [Tepidimonas taiwanensis]|nr:ATP-binding protein [Tepidimonas taiwanensis]MCX7692284.1 ATP-binding protein [Tepidimonas taiwanensis]UBQ06529.1 hypothetical protein LCC91_05480 [Tepidimonas taiwanensis]